MYVIFFGIFKDPLVKVDTVCELPVSEIPGMCAKITSSWAPTQIYWISVGALESAC